MSIKFKVEPMETLAGMGFQIFVAKGSGEFNEANQDYVRNCAFILDDFSDMSKLALFMQQSLQTIFDSYVEVGKD